MTVPREIQLSQWRKNAVNYSKLKRESQVTIDDLKKEKEELGHQLNIDPLTQIYNRRLFETMVGDLNTRRDVGIVIFDTDNFKEINDSQGHDKGDEILKKIAQIINENCHTRLPSTDDQVRAFDYPFRFGGDEFGLLLIEIQPKDVSKVVNRITEKLQQNNISVSSGFAVTSPNLTLREAFVQADQNMYQVKQSKKVGR